MTEKSIKFTTKELAILNRIIAKTNIDLEQLMDNPFLIPNVLPQAIERAEPDIIEFVSSCKDLPIGDVENLDAYEFLDSLEEILISIKWGRLGKRKTILRIFKTLEIDPEKMFSEIKAEIIAELKKKESDNPEKNTKET